MSRQPAPRHEWTSLAKNAWTCLKCLAGKIILPGPDGGTLYHTKGSEKLVPEEPPCLAKDESKRKGAKP